MYCKINSGQNREKTRKRIEHFLVSVQVLKGLLPCAAAFSLLNPLASAHLEAAEVFS